LDFQKLCDDPKWTRSHIASLREQAVREVGPPHRAAQAILQQMPLPQALVALVVPAWVPWLAHNREFCRSAVLRLSSDHAVEIFYQFMYATQNQIEYQEGARRDSVWAKLSVADETQPECPLLFVATMALHAA
jgi:hypothetical protein